MTYAVLLPLMCLTVAAGQEHGGGTNRPASRADVEAGAKTFRSHCAVCHGPHGEGGRGPNLANGQFYHGSSDADLLENISKGIPSTEMPGLFYSADRIRQIIAYIRSLNSAAGVKPGGQPSEGAALVRSRGCLQCHRISGEGGRLGPDLTSIGQMRSPEYLWQSIVDPDADINPRFKTVSFRDDSGTRYQGFLMNEDTYTVQLLDTHEQLHSFAKAELSNYKIEDKSPMPSYKSTLSDAQLQDVVAYLSSLRPQGGRR